MLLKFDLQIEKIIVLPSISQEIASRDAELVDIDNQQHILQL